MKIKSLIKHNLMRAAMTLALILACAAAWAENVETYYIDENGTRHDVTATVVTTYMDNLGTDDETTWYVVNENVFLYDGSNNQTCLHGNVNLIIADGCELKPASGSSGSSDGFRGSGNLTLYGQNAGTGTLSCGQEGFMNITGDFTVCSGMVSVSGNRYNAIRAANFTMRGGSVSITNNTNNDCGIGATGTVNIYSGSVVAAGTIGIAAGTVNIYGGSVTARCNGRNAPGSNYGYAIKCSSTFNFYGGNVTAQGDDNWREGQTRYGIHANSINLSWTSTDDWIYNTKDDNSDNVICYFVGSGGMNIAPYKPFTDGTTTYTGTLTDEQVEALANQTLQPVVPTFANSGDGTPEHPYTIYNATGWGEFCDALQDATYNHFSGKTVKLGANISITQSAGSNDHRFMGTFDGQEHTLDVDITDTGEQGTAPFRFISTATIRNLHVTGTVTGTTHAAGLVGKAIAGTILIENCLVETNVNSTVGNNRHCGGIVGHGFGGNNPVDLTLRNCVYAGTITCDKNYIGGLQGWSDGNTLTLENCLFAGNYQGTATGTAAFHPIALHNTGSATNLTATNVFAAVAPTATNANFIAADGTKTTGRTTAPAGLGTQGATYSFMDMTVYENGLYYNGLYYVAPTLSTDNSGAYLINNEDDWTNFCDALYNNATWNRFSGQTVKLGADISVSRMAGYDNHDFLGTFDGNHDTLTFTATATASYLAPFRNVLGNSTTDRAVIRDLNVVTNITAHDQRHMAGLIALVWGYVDVTNCNVTVNISSTKGSTNTDLYPAGIASQVVKDAQIAVSGCTVDGTISTDGKYAGGIIGIAQGSASITDCLSSVTINSSTEGDGTHGGFVGVQGNYDGKTITIEGCVFNGQLLGASTHSCGGFLGWRSKTVNISNSLFAPVQVTINTTDGSTPCATFVRNGDSNTTITDCYYTTALGTAQGTQVYSISKGEYVTTLEINGTANPSYTVSGLGFYSTGIKCGDVLYAAENNQVSLTLANNANPPLGYQYDYTVTGGATLNGNTLTMAHDDVTVSVDTESALHSTGQPVSVTYMNADGTTGTHEAIALDETMTTLAGGWYFVGKDIAYNSTITLNGDVTIILADGKTMSVGTSDTPISGDAIKGEIGNWPNHYYYALTVYGQSLADSTAGTLSLHTSSVGIYVKAYTQHSGKVSITSVYNSGIWTLGDAVTINGGHLDVNVGNVAIFAYSDVIINGGTVNATGQGEGISSSNNGNITLGWTNTSDYIYANSYETTGTIAIASGQAFIDENNVVYSGTVNASDLNGKTLHPIDGCLPPSHLTATDITTTTATLTWTSDAEDFDMEYAINPASTFDFDDGTLQGWTNLIVNQGGGHWVHSENHPCEYDYSSYAHSGSGFALSYSYINCDEEAYNTDVYLVSPQPYQITEGASLTFFYKQANESWQEYFEVCVATAANPTAINFTDIWNSSSESSSGWTEVNISLDDYAGQTIWIAFHDEDENVWEVWIDDVTINPGAVWTPVNESISTNQYTLTGLAPETTYLVRVRANCDADDVSLWSNIATFTTLDPCEIVPSELTATNITATSATLNWSGYQDNYNVRYRTAGGEEFNFFEGFEGCDWTLPNGWTTTEGAWFACNNCNEIEAHSGGYFAGGYSSGTWLITPMMDLSGQNNVTLNFWYINVDQWGSDPAQLEVYYRIVEDDEPTNWEWLWSSEGSHTQWTEATISLTEDLSANYQIRFYLSQGNPVFLDDISITSTGTRANEWQTIDNIADTTTTVTGLTPETPYEWQVQGRDCDGNDGTTEWSEAGYFTTPDPCEAPSGLTVTDITTSTATLNWSGVQDSYVVIYRTADVVADTLLNEGFEGYEYPDFPEGWTNNGWFVNDYYHHSGANSVEIDWNADLITPVLEISENANVVINFWYITEESDEVTPQLEVYYSPAEYPEDRYPLWSSVGSHPDWTEASIAVEDCGNIQLVFTVSGSDDYFYVYLDDITVTSYTGYGEWQTIDSLAATTTTLTGLTPEKPYQWQVRGISEYCPYSHPEWSERGSFTTPLHDPVAYINENGEQQLCTEYTVLTGTETTLAAGWYVADSTLNYSQTLILSGDIHLILKDNAVMNVTSTEGYGFYYYSSSIPPSISIYAQSTGESKGQLHVDASVHGLYTRNDITINGGWVEATSNQSYGIFASSGNVIINGGIVEATGGVYGIFGGGNSVEIHGGEVTAIGPSYGINAQPGSVVISGGKVTTTATNGTGIHARYSITISGGQVTANGRYDGIYTYDGIILGWTNASDFIYASSFYINNSNNYITLSKAFKDEAGQTYSGTIAKESGGAYPIDGKWLYPNCVVMKQVEGYEEGNGDWVFIASPVAGSIAPSEVHNLFPSAGETSNEYDLYRFNQSSSNGKEWQNWKQDEGHNNVAPGFSLVNGQGYLYASKETRTLVFTGEYTAATEPVEVPLDYDEYAELAGWNLVGNPFTTQATMTNGNGQAVSFYVINGQNVVPYEGSATTIEPCTGVMVKAEGTGESVFFTSVSPDEAPQPNKGSLQIALSQVTSSLRGTKQSSTLDNAIISFNEGSKLSKFYFGEQNANIYIPQDNEEYAIAFSESQGEMPLNFKAKENGTYTISVDVDNVEMGYLHLIDNLTGADVDLLTPPACGHPLSEGEARSGAELGSNSPATDSQTPAGFPLCKGGQGDSKSASYTFTAKTTDYESRFRLVFSICEDANGDNEAFAFISNGNIIVNGEGTLQVFDVLGHQLVTKQLPTLNSKL